MEQLTMVEDVFLILAGLQAKTALVAFVHVLLPKVL